MSIDALMSKMQLRSAAAMQFADLIVVTANFLKKFQISVGAEVMPIDRQF